MKRFRSTGAKIAIIGSIALFVVLWTVMIVAALTGGNDPFQLTTLDPQGPFSTLIDNLVAPVFIIAGLVFVGVLGAILYIVLRYREKGDPELDTAPMPKQTHGHTAAEITWTAIPAAILAVVAVLTAITILDLAAEEPDSLQVEVFGQQWWWGYRYDIDNDGRFDSDTDVETATELIIPVGRPVQLSVTSNDVIHSFWIPALNGKRDAVPGLVSPWATGFCSPTTSRTSRPSSSARAN